MAGWRQVVKRTDWDYVPSQVGGMLLVVRDFKPVTTKYGNGYVALCDSIGDLPTDENHYRVVVQNQATIPDVETFLEAVSEGKASFPVAIVFGFVKSGDHDGYWLLFDPDDDDCPELVSITSFDDIPELER